MLSELSADPSVSNMSSEPLPPRHPQLAHMSGLPDMDEDPIEDVVDEETKLMLEMSVLPWMDSDSRSATHGKVFAAEDRRT